MICYDREFPESARILMLQGAEVILLPNACGLDLNRLMQVRVRAYENIVGGGDDQLRCPLRQRSLAGW